MSRMDTHTDGWMDRRTDNVKTVYPTTNKVCEGYNDVHNSLRLEPANCAVHQRLGFMCTSAIVIIKAAMIHSPHEMIHTVILASRYDTYHDTLFRLEIISNCMRMEFNYGVHHTSKFV